MKSFLPIFVGYVVFSIPAILVAIRYAFFSTERLNIIKNKKLTNLINNYLSMCSGSRLTIVAILCRGIYTLFVILSLAVFAFATCVFLCFLFDYFESKTYIESYPDCWNKYYAIQYPMDDDIERAEKKIKDIEETYFLTEEIKERIIDRKLVYIMKEKQKTQKSLLQEN
jgi:hypothetical protein